MFTSCTPAAENSHWPAHVLPVSDIGYQRRHSINNSIIFARSFFLQITDRQVTSSKVRATHSTHYKINVGEPI